MKLFLKIGKQNMSARKWKMKAIKNLLLFNYLI